MSKFARYASLAKRFSEAGVDFLVVYIEEAHPSDGWAFANNGKTPRHRCLEDRIHAAGKLQDAIGDAPVDLCVDGMHDEASLTYGALYERVYVLQDGTVSMAGQRGPRGYSLDVLQDWLENRFPGWTGEGCTDGDIGKCILT